MIEVKVYFGETLLLINEFKSDSECNKYLKKLAKGREKVKNDTYFKFKVITQKIKIY